MLVRITMTLEQVETKFTREAVRKTMESHLRSAASLNGAEYLVDRVLENQSHATVGLGEIMSPVKSVHVEVVA